MFRVGRIEGIVLGRDVEMLCNRRGRFVLSSSARTSWACIVDKQTINMNRYFHGRKAIAVALITVECILNNFFFEPFDFTWRKRLTSSKLMLLLQDFFFACFTICTTKHLSNIASLSFEDLETVFFLLVAAVIAAAVESAWRSAILPISSS
jgi:hypothetical protein